MKSFAFRITCRFAVLVTATTAVVLTIGGFLLDHETEHGLELLHDIEVREMAELLGEDGSLTAAEVADRIKHDSDSDAALFVMQVADARGRVLFRSENLGAMILPANAASEKHWTTTVPSIGRVHLSAHAVGPWRIQIGSRLEPSERLLRDYVRMTVPLLVGAAAASIVLGFAFSRATLRPIRAIEETANRIRADNLVERIPVPNGRDELAALTRLLNQMFDRLQSSFEQVGRFAADASHELKTPLALIRLNVEKLRTRVAGDVETESLAGEVLEEIGRLHRFIDRLLFLAKAEGGALTVVRQRVDMADFVASFAEDAQALAEDRGVRFAVKRSDRGEVRAEAGLLRQLLLNLVTNAVAVSREGGAVELESVASEGGWRLSILDEGPGIAETELPRIFERFVQLPSPRTTRAGHGLGLAICRSIAELHGGRIAATNRKDRRGLRVEVSLPR